MNPDRSSRARQAVQNARQALERGDPEEARRWAELAASLAPDWEQPWLILAAVASPHASLSYLRKALAINPESQSAQRGMQWALERLGEDSSSVPAAPAVALSVETPRPANPRQGSIFPLLLFVLVGGMLVWEAVSASFSPAQASVRSDFHAVISETSQHGAQVQVAKPTYTPTPTFTPSPTPTASPTPIPTDTPTPSPEPTQTTRPTQPPVSYAPTGPPVPPSLPNGKHILVDISEQHLYAYKGEKLVFSFVASTGMNNATRVGHFSVLDKLPNAYGATWNIWMPDWLGIYWAGGLENGIHALPILPGGTRLWSGYLGTPISYGCVVLGVDEAHRLYDWAEVGTAVDIQW
jgi:hypothetical protein